MADRPLRPANHRSHGGPLPRHLANGTRADLQAGTASRQPPFASASAEAVVLCGISEPFGSLFPTRRYVTHVLLTRAPLYSGCPFLARLACVKRAASVRSEPGSNSLINVSRPELTFETRHCCEPTNASFACYPVFKERTTYTVQRKSPTCFRETLRPALRWIFRSLSRSRTGYSVGPKCYGHRSGSSSPAAKIFPNRCNRCFRPLRLVSRLRPTWSDWRAVSTSGGSGEPAIASVGQYCATAWRCCQSLPRAFFEVLRR